MISIKHFVVFIVGAMIAYLLTCSKYTTRTTPLLMMTIIIELFLERCIVNWYLNSDNTTSIMVRSSSRISYIIILSHRKDCILFYG